MARKGYICDESELGAVYYPGEGVTLADKIAVNYVVYPWLERCETEGIEIASQGLAQFSFSVRAEEEPSVAV